MTHQKAKETTQKDETDHLGKFDELLEEFDNIGKENVPSSDPPTVEPDQPDEPGRFVSDQTEQDMLNWARVVERNGVYLEFLDVAAAHSGLNHWVPASLKEELDTPDVHWNNARALVKRKLAKEMKALQKHESSCKDDEAILASVQTHREHVHKCYQNFFQMQQEAWESRGLLCQHVEGDGNCGVYMLLTMIHDVRMQEVDVAQAARFRIELRKLWEQHAPLPMWQKVWRVLRERLGSNQPQEPKTPKGGGKKNAQEQGLPFTPDKLTGKKRLLPAAAGNTPDRDVVVPGTDAAEEPERKRPKPTGKAKPIEERLTFKAYFERWLAEAGITYRTWVSQHRADQIWVCLGAERKWPDNCESCQRLLQREHIDKEGAAHMIVKLQEKVKVDIERWKERLMKPLKRKKGSEVEQKSAKLKSQDDVKEEIKVKEEPEVKVKQEPQEVVEQPQADGWNDVEMGKQELARTGLSLSYHCFILFP
eukprot:s3656_g2.t1